MPITREQAEVLKTEVDGDANLAGYNLKLKNVPDYNKWERKWLKTNKPPEDPGFGASDEAYTAFYKGWDDYKAARDSAWMEVVNTSLLPENVKGACVIGGFAIAALKAGYKIMLGDLISRGVNVVYDFEAALGASLGGLPGKTVSVLQEFTGLEYRELEILQSTNDAFSSERSYWNNPFTQAYEVNPWQGKPAYQITRARRRALKKQIDSFVV